MNKNQNNRFIGVLIGLFVLIIIQNIANVSALDLLDDIPANEYRWEFYEQSPQKRDNHFYLFNYKQPYGELSFKSNGNCTIYFVNSTEAIKFFNSENFEPILTFSNRTELSTEFSYEYLTDTLGIDNKTEILKSVTNYYVPIYIVVYNEMDYAVTFNIRIGYENEFVSFLNNTSDLILTFGFITLSLFLFLQSQRDKKAGEIEKSNILRNYGFGYLTGFLILGIWETYHWLLDTKPETRWEINLDFTVPVEVFSQNILVMLTLFGFGLSIMFMSFTVEKQVQGKNHPIISIILLISSSLLLVGIAIPTTLIYVMIIWIIVLFVTNINIGLTYLKVIRNTEGMIRKKTIMVLTGFLSVYLSIAIRDFLWPQFILNFLGVISFIVFYKGIE